MNRTLITQANIINEGETFTGHLLIENDRIAQISRQPAPPLYPTAHGLSVQQASGSCQESSTTRSISEIPD